MVQVLYLLSSHLRLSKKSPRFDACEGVVGRYSALEAAGAGIPLTRCDQSLLMNDLPFDFLLFGYEEFILSSPLPYTYCRRLYER